MILSKLLVLCLLDFSVVDGVVDIDDDDDDGDIDDDDDGDDDGDGDGDDDIAILSPNAVICTCSYFN